MVTEDRVLKNDFLQQLDEFIGKVSSHEGLYRHRHVFGVLGFR